MIGILRIQRSHVFSTLANAMLPNIVRNEFTKQRMQFHTSLIKRVSFTVDLSLSGVETMLENIKRNHRTDLYVNL